MMIIDAALTPLGSSAERRSAGTGTQFTAALAECGANPLFAPWPLVDQSLRTNVIANGAALNTHPTTSNRREGRHARG